MISLGSILKRIREARKLSQKELASQIGMAQAQYSRLESGKNDPSFTAVTKIAAALGLTLSELFRADEIFSEVNSHDKTLMEKLRLLDGLEEVEKQSVYNIIDALVAKKKLKDNLKSLVD